MATDAIQGTRSEPGTRESIVGRFKYVGRILYEAGLEWSHDNAMRLSAAVAMYTILSLSPLLVITIKILAIIFGDEAASQQVTRQVDEFLGPTGSQAVRAMITATVKPGAGVLATAISFGVLLFTASGVFNEIRSSLNEVWEVSPAERGGWWDLIRDRFLSIGMVFVIGFLLLVSQAVTTALTVTSEYIMGGPGWLASAIDFLASTLAVAVLFGLIFRFLADAPLAWRDVLFGAIVTSLLFKVGQYLLALYFTYGSTASAYGAAGSFVVVLLWVYYSCWILFYGAELIQVRLRHQGRRVSQAGPDEKK